ALLADDSRRDSRAPLVVVDEITCLVLLAELRGMGIQATLLLPLVGDPADVEVIQSPEFRLGICVSRNERLSHAKNRELIEFVRDGLSLHIEAHARRIACEYVNLRSRIDFMLTQAVPECPRREREQWLTRTFRLSDTHDLSQQEPAHWRAVLAEATKML